MLAFLPPTKCKSQTPNLSHIYADSELEGLRVFGTADARRDVLDTCTHATKKASFPSAMPGQHSPVSSQQLSKASDRRFAKSRSD